MTSFAFDNYMVGGTGKDAPSDILEQKRAIRLMCGYISDDSKIASYHGVSQEFVAQVRNSTTTQNRKKSSRQNHGHDATGAHSLFAADNRMRESMKRGSDMLRDAMLLALGQRVG
jgi:hypothetical protein